MNGTIFDIQRFSIDDGPGIRTVVFLKGCNMRCLWCHNPESQNEYTEIMFYPHKCIGCGKCFEVCPQNCHTRNGDERLFIRELCKRCGECAADCYAGALEKTGHNAMVSEVIDEVKKDDLFYKNSGGGVTFSGGEPLLQVDFLRELLIECKKLGYHCAVETAGNATWAEFEKIIPYTDLFLYDVKVIDEELHKKVTGVGNKRIIANLKKLAKQETEIWVRTPEISGVNDTTEEKQRLSELLEGIEMVKKHVYLPYHSLGEGKYRSLGISPPSLHNL
ncbi:MAG: glycyl-radical enzyme activating protein [Eubacteriales bacterium]